MKPALSRIEFLERKYVLEALLRLAESNQINTSDSSKYDLVYEGLRYSPSKVIALALSLMHDGDVNPKNLSKIQEPAYIKALIRCGFTLTPKKKDVDLSLKESFAKILNFQKSYSSKNTPEMQQRGELIRHGVPDILRNDIESLEPIFSNAGFSCSIKGSDSIGNKTVSPWVRIFDPIMSPSATEGWYVVIHFSSDGQKVYLTLGRGATILKDGGLRDVPDSELAEQNNWARKIISGKFSAAKNFKDKIELGGNKLSIQFEKATTFAKCFTIEALNEEEFHRDLKLICEFLIPLYELERQGKNPYVELPEMAELVEVIEQITSPRKKSGRGQGRGLTHPERKAIELRAMSVCKEELIKLGFTKIKDMSANNSFDYSGHFNGVDWLIEVKGTTSIEGDSFLLSSREFKLHKKEVGKTILVIVYDIDLDKKTDPPMATNGKFDVHMPWNIDLWKFEPQGYTVTKL